MVLQGSATSTGCRAALIYSAALRWQAGAFLNIVISPPPYTPNIPATQLSIARPHLCTQSPGQRCVYISPPTSLFCSAIKSSLSGRVAGVEPSKLRKQPV